MSSAKKTAPVVAPVDEMRVLNAAAADTPDGETVSNWLTPDFWTMVSAACTNVIAVMVLLGWINASQVNELTQAITALIGATQIIVVNSALVWKYLTNRSQLRERLIDAQTQRYQYMAMIAAERIRVQN